MLDIPVIYEDEDILVIDKPCGVSVEDTGNKDSFTIKDWVNNLPSMGDNSDNKKGEFEQRNGIVHRLDKETSGVLLIAKRQDIYYFLKNLFKYRRVEKVYQALVYGSVKEDEFEIYAPILLSKRNWPKQKVSEEGREALTKFKVVKRYEKEVFGVPITSVLAYPKTGRTHQIRVHLKALGHPIVNDEKYAPVYLLAQSKELFNRMMLHAKSISFVDWAGKYRKFSSQISLVGFENV